MVVFVQPERVVGLKYLERLEPLLERLRPASCERDRAGNRRLFFDNVCSLILLKFFNPALTSLRDLSAASRLKQVRKKLGCNPAAVGTLSEALRVFDPELLVEIVQELLGEIPAATAGDPRLRELQHVATAVDGSLLKLLPQVTQACFAARSDRGWKLHAQFEVLRGVPILGEVTAGDGKEAANEKAVLRRTLEADRCYLIDRGYEEFSLFNAIHKAKSSYVCRVRNDHCFTAVRTRPLSPEALAAHVLEDAVGRMGSPKSKRIKHPDHEQRRVVVEAPTDSQRGGKRRSAGSQPLVLVTNLLDVPAEVVALLYRCRWLIELFFRWLKCVLSCRHLISESQNGIQIQVYCALIACLLIQLTVGGDVKPTQWTHKLMCLYSQGLADEEDVIAHVKQLHAACSADQG